MRGVAQATANADNQLPVSGVTYDGNGNPSQVEGLAATFDILNRATALGSVANTWGGNGLRASKTTSGGTTYYLYDGSVPVCEMGSTGSVTATNTFGAAGLISRRVGSASVFYTFDAQGSVAQRYTSAGSLVSSDLYDGFGKGTSTGSGDVFGYKGQAGYYTDTATGLILCGHRFYDSTQGRFINRDPIGYAGGVNLYGYVGNNASNGVDPSGFEGPNPGRPFGGGGGGDAPGWPINADPPTVGPNGGGFGGGEASCGGSSDGGDLEPPASGGDAGGGNGEAGGGSEGGGSDASSGGNGGGSGGGASPDPYAPFGPSSIDPDGQEPLKPLTFNNPSDYGPKTTVIGRMPDLLPYRGLEGVDTWWDYGRIPGPGESAVSMEENREWIYARLQRGDNFVLATPESELGEYVPGEPNGSFTKYELGWVREGGVEPYHAY